MRSALMTLLTGAVGVVASTGEYINLDLFGIPEPLDPVNYQYYGYLRNLDAISTTVDFTCHDDKLMNSGIPAAATPDPACDPINSVAVYFGGTGISVLATRTESESGAKPTTATVRVSCRVTGSVEARCTATRSGYDEQSVLTTQTYSTVLASPLPTRRVTVTGGIEFLASFSKTNTRTYTGPSNVVAEWGNTESLTHATAPPAITSAATLSTSFIGSETASTDIDSETDTISASATSSLSATSSSSSIASTRSVTSATVSQSTNSQTVVGGAAPASTTASTANGQIAAAKNDAGRSMGDAVIPAMLVGTSGLVTVLAFML